MLSDEVKATVLEALVAKKNWLLFKQLASEEKLHDVNVEIIRINSALAAINGATVAQGWEPLADGEYIIDSVTLNVCCDGQELEQWRTANVYKDDSPKDVQEITLGEYRLFQRIGTREEAGNVGKDD
jgi:hypothetical protein